MLNASAQEYLNQIPIYASYSDDDSYSDNEYVEYLDYSDYSDGPETEEDD